MEGNDHLFPQELRVEVVVERLLVVVADGQIGVGIHDDAVLVHLLYLFQVDDVGTVYAHEVRRQVLLDLLHREEGDQWLGRALEVEF